MMRSVEAFREETCLELIAGVEKLHGEEKK